MLLCKVTVSHNCIILLLLIATSSPNAPSYIKPSTSSVVAMLALVLANAASVNCAINNIRMLLQAIIIITCFTRKCNRQFPIP